MDDEFKKEYKKADLHLEGTSKDDESELSESRQSKPRVHKVVMSDLELEQLLISELEKQGVKPEVKVPFDRPYKYPKPYYADIKVGTSLEKL